MTLVTFLTLLNLIHARGALPPNVLIVGSDHARETAQRLITPHFQGPVEVCQFPGPLRLPNGGAAALILREVGTLDRNQQAALLHWLDTPSRIPVVSLHSSSPFALVRSGEFSDRLYYRLNTVLLEDVAAVVH